MDASALQPFSVGTTAGPPLGSSLSNGALLNGLNGSLLNSSLNCHLGVKSVSWSICIQNERRIRHSIDSLPSNLKDANELKMKFTSKHPFREPRRGEESDDKVPAGRSAAKYQRNKRKIRRRTATDRPLASTSSLPTSFRQFAIGNKPNYPNHNSSNSWSDLTAAAARADNVHNDGESNRQSSNRRGRESIGESIEKSIGESSGESVQESSGLFDKESSQQSNRKSKRETNRQASRQASEEAGGGRHKNANKEGPLLEPQSNRFKSSPSESGGPISSISRALFSSPLSSFFLSSPAVSTSSSRQSPEPIEVPLVEPLKNNFTLDSKRSNNEQTSDLLSSSLTPPPGNVDNVTVATDSFTSFGHLVRTAGDRSSLSSRVADDSSPDESRLDGPVDGPVDDRSANGFTQLPSTANSLASSKFVNKKFKKGDHLNERPVVVNDDRSMANRTSTVEPPTSNTAATSDVAINTTDWWLSNSSSIEPPRTYIPEITVKSALLLIGAIFLSLITMLGNMLVMISLIIDRQLRTISNYYLLSLSIADFMIGLISMPLYTLYVLLDRWPLSPLVCDCWLALDYLNSNASVLNLLCISVDRYLSITRPLTYRAKRTAKKAWCWIATTWIISSLLWPPWVFFFPYYEGRWLTLSLSLSLKVSGSSVFVCSCRVLF